MDDRITLYSLIRDDQNILIELYFDDSGHLIFDGYDIKNIIEDAPCKSPYQCTYTIKVEELCKLYQALDITEGNHTEILQKIKDHFGCRNAFILIRRFMNQYGIKFSVFAWP